MSARAADHRQIVFVHGVRTSSAIWTAQIEAMTRSGHQSIAVDLPGHGARVGERFTLRGALEAIGQGVDSFTVKPLVVGLSIGGYSALAYAARHQHKVAGVLLRVPLAFFVPKQMRRLKSLAESIAGESS